MKTRLVKNSLLSLLQKCPFVIPSEDGIQVFQGFLDPGFRRGDGLAEFCKMLFCFLYWGIQNTELFDGPLRNVDARLNFCSIADFRDVADSSFLLIKGPIRTERLYGYQARGHNKIFQME